jgi:RNA polymerase sigma factor (sigma-70 family)
MTSGERSPVTSYLRRMVSLPCAGGLSDAELLQQFVAKRDEAAFEVLVWRHGPKVLGVCRHVLRHEQDAEDAFQATFLVLVRKAGSIGKRQAVGSWLSRVAYRVALRAKVEGDKRAVRETKTPELAASVRPPDLLWRDLRPILDEEVNRLPAKYRAPFILCYVDGKTNEEAAQELGCPKGTVLSRLAWARERLRTRLTRRGLTLSAGLLAAALTTNAAEAGIPTALVESTLKAALLVAAGKSVAEAASESIAALTKGALQTMLWNKIKILTVGVLTVAAFAFGGVLALQVVGARPVSCQPGSMPEAKGEPPSKEEPPPKADKAEPPKAEEKRYSFEMREQPWIKVLEWYTEISGLPYIGISKPTGACTFIPPKDKKYTVAEITDILNEALNAQNYILLRRDASFTVLPADEKIDPTFVPRVRLDDLDKRGKSELVSVVIPLTVLNAREIGPDVKKMQGPFGTIVVLEKGNQLILQDTAGNLRIIRQTIKDIEAREADKKPDRK